MKKLMDKHTIQLAKRLYRDYVRKHYKMMAVTVVLLLIISGTTALQPLLLQQAFDKVFRDKDLTYLMYIPIAVVVLCVVQAIATYYSNLLMARFGNAIVTDTRKDLFRHIINNEIEFYAEHDSGNLLSRIGGETIGIASGVQRFFNAWIKQLITSIGLFIVMVYQSFELTVIALSAFAIAYYPMLKIMRRLKKLVSQSNEKTILMNTRVLESIEGIRVIKAFAKEDFEITKVGQYMYDIEKTNDKVIGVANLTPTLMQILAGVAVAFVIWYGGYQLIHDQMTAGQLIAFTTSLMMISRPIRALTSTGSIMSAALVNTERFYKVIDTKPRRNSRDDGVRIQVKSGEIKFKDVVFQYPNGGRALNGISLTMEAGKKTAIVGYSGSGKSTIFNLLLKFYDPTSGTILIDNQDINEASINSLRASIALVSQDIFIFDDTARNNIGYGREGATDEEIIAAAKAARCHDFIMAMPDGYDTRLGFSGQNLSGGQKQRIAIARAFVRNAPILLLDEATSALDPRTESEIQEALELLTKGRTTIIIAHRLSTVMNADKMIMLDSGEVRAVGTHDELLKNSPAYKDLFGI
jgi:ATP-binding cassette, subfamily B, bacterial MsbA